VAKENGLSNEMTVIGCGTTIRGEVDFDQGARILGVFEGKIRSKGEVHIAESANCSAEIDADSIIIDGKTDGNIMARSRCRLSENARLEGDITAKTLLVEEGASFVGHCRVGESVDTANATPAQTKPATSGTAPAAPRVDFKPPWKGQGTETEAAAEALTDTKRSANAGAA
jgi:cytoskeletal protein CcmA (bactofilin family)